MKAKDGQILANILTVRLEGVLIFGNVQFTTQAVRLMLEHEIEMGLFSSTGKLLGQLTSPAPGNITLRQAQYARAADASFCICFARITVSAKIRNSLELMRQFAHNHPDQDLSHEREQLEQYSRQVDGRMSAGSLLGLEGTAARTYFGAYAKMIRGDAFTFTSRQKLTNEARKRYFYVICYICLLKASGTSWKGGEMRMIFGGYPFWGFNRLFLFPKKPYLSGNQ